MLTSVVEGEPRAINMAPPPDAGAAMSRKFDRMNEPIDVTIKRDVNKIVAKLLYVVSPASRHEQGGILKKWDLWGPLFLCLILSVFLWCKADNTEKHSAFALIFILQWLGAAVVTINAALLGSTAPFFQCLCVLGYSAFPLVGAASVCVILPKYLAILKVAAVVVAVYYCMGASSSFMSKLTTDDKKGLILYPVALYYAIQGWVIAVV